MPKLYEIPRGSKIKCEVSDGSKFVIFDHLDGMYSYCKTEQGGLVHLSASTPLRLLKSGVYKVCT